MPASQIRSLVIKPALGKLSLWSLSAEELVLGTAIVEGGLTYLKQHGEGPALGLWKVEPATHEELYTNYLHYHQDLGMALAELRAAGASMDGNLVANLLYGAVVCRLIYYRRPESLPEAEDIEGQAALWKQHYNTLPGAWNGDQVCLQGRSNPQRSEWLNHVIPPGSYAMRSAKRLSLILRLTSVSLKKNE